MFHLKAMAGAIGTALVVVAGTAGAAQASSPNVVSAIRTQDRLVKDSRAYRDLQHIDVHTSAQAQAALKSFAILRTKLDHAATVVGSASTSDATQQEGQRDWVDGVRKLSRGINQFDLGLRDLLAGRKTDARSEIVLAVKTLKAGDVLGSRGDRLLHLPTNA